MSVVGLLGLKRPDGSHRYRFADEDENGVLGVVTGSKWYVRHYMSFRKRIKCMGLWTFFGVVFLLVLGGGAIWDGLFSDLPESGIAWLGFSFVMFAFSLVPVGVGLLNVAKNLTDVSYWRVRVAVRVAEAAPVVCGVVMWLFLRDVQWPVLVCMYVILPSMVYQAVDGFIVRVEEPADDPKPVVLAHRADYPSCDDKW